MVGARSSSDFCVVLGARMSQSSRVCIDSRRVRWVDEDPQRRWTMPELPDVVLYIERLCARLKGATLQAIRIRSPSLLRTAEPPLRTAFGRKVVGFERLGKRIVTELEGDLFLVLHLMIAGRLKLRPPGAALSGRIAMAAFDFDRGTLVLTEASSRKRTQLYLVQGRGALAQHDPGGIDVFTCSAEEFREVLIAENHTI